MADPYANTISGLLKRRTELMADARELRERMAVVGNDIAALDRTLETLGYQGEMPAPVGVQSSTRVVYFHRNELRRTVRQASNGPSRLSGNVCSVPGAALQCRDVVSHFC